MTGATKQFDALVWVACWTVLGHLLEPSRGAAQPPRDQGAISNEANVPTKAYAQAYVQAFQRSERPDGWNFTSRPSEQFIKFEPAGARFTLPTGGPEKGTSAGLVTAFGVHGDFEITLAFEILADPEPADVGKAGTRLSLAVTLDSTLLPTPQSEIATLSRSMQTKGFVTWMRNREKPASVSHKFPPPVTIGRLRLVRSGADLYFLGAPGANEPFLFFTKYRFGADDLKRIAITTTAGGPKAMLDVRVTDFRIRADAIPAAPATEPGPISDVAAAPQQPATAPGPGGRTWLIVALILALVLATALTLGFVVRRQGRP